MIKINNVKASEVNCIVDMLRQEHGNYVASYNEMFRQEYYDYEDGLVVIVDTDSIVNDL
jgi:hypothetical protein